MTVFASPYFQLYSAIGLFDTHLAVALAHCLFNIPLAVWILEGFMSAVPKELDETAYLDGYSFWRFFLKIFLPTIAVGIGVAAFVIYFVRHDIAKGLPSPSPTATPYSGGYEVVGTGAGWFADRAHTHVTLTDHGAYYQEPFNEAFSQYRPSLGLEAELLSADAGFVHQAALGDGEDGDAVLVRCVYGGPGGNSDGTRLGVELEVPALELVQRFLGLEGDELTVGLTAELKADGYLAQ